jgi:hypothetical protein
MSTDARCYTDQWVTVGDLDEIRHFGLDETLRRAKSEEDVYGNSEWYFKRTGGNEYFDE